MNKGLRFIGILLHLVRGFFVFGFALNSDKIIKQGIKQKKRQRLAAWLAQLLRLFKVEVIIHGASIVPPKMIVSNHISWIDILILSRQYPGHFIAKSEIKSWPVMGAMISSIGTVFVKRGLASELKKLSVQVKQVINNNSSIVFFPEGKTGDGTHINKIYTGLFESAINAQMDIQPVLIIYKDSSGYPSKTVPYINNQTLFASIMDVFGEKKITAHLFVLDPICSHQHTRKEIGLKLNKILAEKLHQELSNTENN